MSDRANRVLWVLVGICLVAIGGAGLSISLGAWGASAPSEVVDPTVVRWWRDGGSASFAAVSFIGLVLVVAGTLLAWAELSRRGQEGLADYALSGPPGLYRSMAAPDLGTADPGAAVDAGGEGLLTSRSSRGSTTVRAAPLSTALAAQLKHMSGVRRASVGLFGAPGELELRARLAIGDWVELADLSSDFNRVLERFALTAGIFPSVVEVTLSFLPEAFLPEAFLPEAFLPEAFLPEAFLPEAFLPEEAEPPP